MQNMAQTRSFGSLQTLDLLFRNKKFQVGTTQVQFINKEYIHDENM